jgi:hypothetical protein
MDKRDPVVMQAIKNVIGTQAVDFGCISRSSERTKGIYDEIRRLDLERVQSEHRGTAEVETHPNTGTGVAVSLALRMSNASSSLRRTHASEVWSGANRRRNAVVGSAAA